MAGIQFQDGGELRRRNITAVIYGAPNVGKTSLALTARQPCIFDFDGNIENATNRAGVPTVRATQFSQVSSPEPADFKGISTAVIDPVGGVVDLILSELLTNPKMRTSTGVAIAAWSELNRLFSLWVTKLKNCGIDVVMVAHTAEEQRGEDVAERIDVIGKSKNLIYKTAQIMGLLYVAPDGRRIITFDPVHGTYRKNVGIEDQVIRHPSREPNRLAEIVAEAKVRINERLMRDSEEAQQLIDVSRMVDALSTVTQINEHTKVMANPDNPAPDSHKRLLLDRARDLGFIYYRPLSEWFENEHDAKAEETRRADAAKAEAERAKAPPKRGENGAQRADKPAPVSQPAPGASGAAERTGAAGSGKPQAGSDAGDGDLF